MCNGLLWHDIHCVSCAQNAGCEIEWSSEADDVEFNREPAITSPSDMVRVLNLAFCDFCVV